MVRPAWAWLRSSPEPGRKKGLAPWPPPPSPAPPVQAFFLGRASAPSLSWGQGWEGPPPPTAPCSLTQTSSWFSGARPGHRMAPEGSAVSHSTSRSPLVLWGGRLQMLPARAPGGQPGDLLLPPLPWQAFHLLCRGPNAEVPGLRQPQAASQRLSSPLPRAKHSRDEWQECSYRYYVQTTGL